jgi:hypothetical protein
MWDSEPLLWTSHHSADSTCGDGLGAGPPGLTSIQTSTNGLDLVVGRVQPIVDNGHVEMVNPQLRCTPDAVMQAITIIEAPESQDVKTEQTTSKQER